MTSLNPSLLHVFVRRTIAALAIRSFSEASRKRVNFNQFGSIQQSDIPIEKPLRPKRDFDNPRPTTSKHRIRELTITRVAKKHETVVVEESSVECSRKDYNPNRYEDGHLVLFSKYWDKNKYKDQWIKVRKTAKQAKPGVALCTWDEFVPDLLDPILAASLRDLEFANPTDIQARMLRYFSSENHLFLAAETGSGKTVAYATPLISHIVRQKKRGRSCKGIVLVATSSLSHQTSAVLKKLAERTGVTVATPGNCENTPWDILVGTPGLVAKELGSLSSTDSISHMVLDEADFLLDESFVDVITDILSLVPVAHSETNLRNRTEGVKVIFCSASCPEELECIVEGVVDKAKLSYVKSGGLHKLPLSVDLTFVRVREMDKFERLGKLIDADLKRGQQNQTIVFCKDRLTAKFVAGELKRSGRNAVLWKSYSSPLEIEEAKVIVATDAAARGLDLPCLSHVIQYDMSKHVVDYLHRIGRVGRLSSLFPGRVTAFVRTTPEIRVTNLIETAARRGKPLQSIETDIAGMLERKRVSDREE